MRKPPTGELCAGEPHAQFGGRGGETLSDPYPRQTALCDGEPSNTKLAVPGESAVTEQAVEKEHLFGVVARIGQTNAPFTRRFRSLLRQPSAAAAGCSIPRAGGQRC